MIDDRFEERLREVAREYHQPPETPRDAMWSAIAAERRHRAEPRVFVFRPALRWGLGMAAVLLVGIAIGVWIRPNSTPVTQRAGRSTSDVAYGVAAVQYLNRTETLLTGFRADARAGSVDTLFVQQARELLLSTRLLLQCQCPAGRDPRLKPLLEDLELVLAQIALLPNSHDTVDVDLITQGMDQQSVLTRLRTAIPAGPASAPRTQGAL